MPSTKITDREQLIDSARAARTQRRRVLRGLRDGIGGSLVCTVRPDRVSESASRTTRNQHPQIACMRHRDTANLHREWRQIEAPTDISGNQLDDRNVSGGPKRPPLEVDHRMHGPPNQQSLRLQDQRGRLRLRDLYRGT
jgi:hypothetical protein